MSKPAEAGDIEVGNVVVACEKASAMKPDVAEVTSITDEIVTLACFGTGSASPKAAKFMRYTLMAQMFSWASCHATRQLHDGHGK